MQRRRSAGAIGAGLFAAILTCADAIAGPCDDAAAMAVILVDPGAVPLRVEGQVFGVDGRTPAAGVLVYVHHTGVNGLYDSTPDGTPRRQAYMRSDANGRFEFRTGMPAPYPNRAQPAHIHLHLWGEGVPHQWTDDILFADDPVGERGHARAQSSAAGRFAWVSAAPPENGVRVERRAIRLKANGDRFDPRMRFGLRTCGAA